MDCICGHRDTSHVAGTGSCVTLGCRCRSFSLAAPAAPRLARPEPVPGPVESFMNVPPAAGPPQPAQAGEKPPYAATEVRVAPVEGENERLRALQAEREAVYGDTATNMRTLGISWTALIESHYRIKLSHPIPPHVAALILVHLKTVRMCGPGYHADNYDDAANFLRFADECDERNPNASKA